MGVSADALADSPPAGPTTPTPTAVACGPSTPVTPPCKTRHVYIYMIPHIVGLTGGDIHVGQLSTARSSRANPPATTPSSRTVRHTHRPLPVRCAVQPPA